MIKFTDMDQLCSHEIYDGSMTEIIKDKIEATLSNIFQVGAKKCNWMDGTRWPVCFISLLLLWPHEDTFSYQEDATIQNVLVSDEYKETLTRLFPNPNVEDIVMGEFVKFIAWTSQNLTTLLGEYTKKCIHDNTFIVKDLFTCSLFPSRFSHKYSFWIISKWWAKGAL